MAQSSVTTNETTQNTVDWDTLREEGLRLLQEMTGHIWTDYNVHDPGVTILETLCYAITDLQTRLATSIEDLLTPKPEQEIQSRFFSPAEILTTNPVTINDYRKLLIDIEGVKNAWLEKEDDLEPNLYYDRDNNALVYDYTSHSEKLYLNGLYRVFIEKDEDVVDDTSLRERVKETLHSHRNLCEDFDEIQIMQQETVSIFSDIEIDDNVTDAHELMAAIYYEIEKFIAPRIKQYSLKRMLQKGKRIDEIFNGPRLSNGFIDDDELTSGTKKTELHTSDLIRIIMSHKGIKNVKNLFVSNKPNPEMSEKKEWALPLDTTRALLLEAFNSSKLRFFKDETLVPLRATQVQKKVDELKEEERYDMYDNPAVDLEEVLGTYTDLTSYEPLAHSLPATYGISQAGLPAAASAQRTAQTKQLKAYFLFFEQILVNYFKQLETFKHNFSLKQEKDLLVQTYFSEMLPEESWKDLFPETENAYTYQEDDPASSQKEKAFTRRNRILNHLLAQFNETFAEYALFGYNMLAGVELEAKMPAFLQAKATFLAAYPELSRNRNRAYNCCPEENQNEPLTDGLKNLIAKKLGFDQHREDLTAQKEFDNFHIVEHIHLRPTGSLQLDFISSEKIDTTYQPDPYSYRLTFVIPTNIERFSNRKFKELVYKTIAAETPAHISYTILEFDTTQMNTFINNYSNFLQTLQQHKRDDLAVQNPYRNVLIEKLSIGKVKQPVLHLHADSAETGSATLIDEDPVDGHPVVRWNDLSGKNHDATVTGEAPLYIKETGEGHAFLKCNEQSGLAVDATLFTNDFSMILVYNVTNVQETEERCNLISSFQDNKEKFALYSDATGNLVASLQSEEVSFDATLDIPHIVTCTFDAATGRLEISLDGQTGNKTILDITGAALQHTKLLIGPATNQASCYIGEIIILDSLLSGERKEKLEQYLSLNWGIPLSAVSSIAKPVLHLDATCSESVIRTENANRVLQWEDLSQKNNHAIQDTNASRPVYQTEAINENAALYFEESNMLLNNEGTQKIFSTDFTLAILYRAEEPGGHLIDGSLQEEDEEKRNFHLALGERAECILTAGDSEVSISSGTDTAHLAIITGTKENNALVLAIYLDGKARAQTTCSETDVFDKIPATLMLGQEQNGAHSFTGYIGEIISYDQALTTRERQCLEHFLSSKWGVDISGINQFATPAAHLDASREASVILDESGTVAKISAWQDQGVCNNSAVQENLLRRPEYTVDGINNLGSIIFTHTEDTSTGDRYNDALVLERTIEDDFTMIIVFKADAAYYTGDTSDLITNVTESSSWTEGAGLLDADCSGLYNDFGISIGMANGNMVVMAGVGDRQTEDHTIITNELALDQTHLLIFSRTKSNGNVSLYADGLFQAEADLRDDVTLNDARYITIGNFNSEGPPFHGMIGEVIILDKVLSDEARQQVETYLSAKWGIRVTRLPLDTTGLALHLDASVTESITRDDQDYVSQWNDLSDSTSDVAALQTVTELQPLYTNKNINDLPAISFNTSCLQVTPELPLGDDFTIAMVYTTRSNGNTSPGWQYGAGMLGTYSAEHNNHFGLAISDDSKLMFRVGTETIGSSYSETVHIALVTRQKEKGRVELYLDGTLAASKNDLLAGTSLNTIKQLTIGAIQDQAYFHGSIAEIVLFNRLLEKDDRQRLEHYFSLKWGIDLSGLGMIGSPVLHLDASVLDTVKINAEQKVYEWSDRTGTIYPAQQSNTSRQPYYVENAYNGLGAVHFENAFLTIPRMIKDDFTVMVVYKADADIADVNFMPVPRHAFSDIAYVDVATSEAIWQLLQGNDYLDTDGNVLDKFTPGEAAFTLNGFTPESFSSIKKKIETDILTLLVTAKNSNAPLDQQACTEIAGINEELSLTLWNRLFAQKAINLDGSVQLACGFDFAILDELRQKQTGELFYLMFTNEQLDASSCAGITGVSIEEGEHIFQNLQEQEFLLATGNVKRERVPALTLAYDREIVLAVIEIIMNKQANREYLPGNAFTDINTIGATRSQQIWQQLLATGIINQDGYILLDLTLPSEILDSVALATKVALLYLLLHNQQVTATSFVDTKGIDNAGSEIIYNELIAREALTTDGHVSMHFIINYDFDAHLHCAIFSLLMDHKLTGDPVSENSFTVIAGIDEAVSTDTWNRLRERSYLDQTGKVTSSFPPATLIDIDALFESLIIQVMLTRNWFAGVGLFDGNAAGDRSDMSKRDFGMLVSREGTLMAGIGSLENKDNKLETYAGFDWLHTAIVTREKDSGIVSLYLDSQSPVQAKFARKLSLQDADRFTIGAVNTGGNYFKGDIAEIIVFARALDRNEVETAQHYLEQKWQLAPVLQLDASQEARIVKDENNRISSWGEKAEQAESTLQPLHDTTGTLPLVRFENNYMTVPNVLRHDFTTVVVFQSETQQASAYMPLPENAFHGIAEMSALHSSIIWNYLQDEKIIDSNGNVVVAALPEPEKTLKALFSVDFETAIITKIDELKNNTQPLTPDTFSSIPYIDQTLSESLYARLEGNGYIDAAGIIQELFQSDAPGFSLGIELNFSRITTSLKTRIITTLISNEGRVVPETLFTAISGITPYVSGKIREELQQAKYLDATGNIQATFTPQAQHFELAIATEEIISLAATEVLRKKNWLEGVGLLDGHAAGDEAEPVKDDFGIIIDKTGKLIAGGGKERQTVESDILDTALHLAIITREQTNGMLTLYLDNENGVTNSFSAHIPFDAIETLTLGAVQTGGQYFKGAIAELICFEKLLSDLEREQVRKYLSRKWELGL